MTTQIKVPSLPESVADATVSTWHKKPGDVVKRDENLVDLETDKVMLEVPSPVDGILKEIVKNTGATVKSNELLAVIEAGASAKAESKSETKTESKAESKSKEEPKSTAKAAQAGPGARRVAAEHEVEIAQVSGSGRAGRVTSEDVLTQIQKTSSPKSTVEIENTGRVEKRVPMSRLRARIAERLLEAQHNAAILTTFNEVNLKNVMELRARYKDAFEKKYNVRLGFMSFFTCAAVEALKQFPAVNASIDGNDIVYHGYYDIGIAVSTERGLVVPVLRNVDQLNFAAIERDIAEFGRKARDGQITMEDMTGGTFTITNGGVFGSLLATPIINPPQSAILGMHKIEERPVVENGQIVIRPMMYIALSYDHRIIDGKESVSFLVKIKEYLEDPARLLLDV
jgi:2-oxoglutarate dehydrogenase E2 component (dihydrolipoamide succinyltransferase)